MTYEGSLYLNWRNMGQLPDNIYRMPVSVVGLLFAIANDIDGKKKKKSNF